jgi:hypothetical protein
MTEGSHVSDQDFFFDEEDEKPAKAEAKSSATSPARKPAGSGAKAPAAAPASGAFFDQTVTMSVASLLIVCSLLVGLIGGILIGQARANSIPEPTAGATSGTGGTGQGTAPALTQDQLNSGQLPAGHPSIGGAATGTPSGTATGSQNATGK